MRGARRRTAVEQEEVETTMLQLGWYVGATNVPTAGAVKMDNSTAYLQSQVYLNIICVCRMPGNVAHEI